MGILARLLGKASSQLDICWLTGDLAIGSAPRDSDWQPVRQAGIRAVIDLRAEAPDNAALVSGREGLAYLRLPIKEFTAPGEDELRLVTDWVVEHIGRGEPVLVHCREGRGRSALVACATLVRLGLPMKDAYQMLLRARPQAALSQAQEDLLKRLAEANALRGEQSRSGEDDL